MRHMQAVRMWWPLAGGSGELRSLFTSGAKVKNNSVRPMQSVAENCNTYSEGRQKAMRITKVTVKAGISRCKDFQTVKYELEEEVEINENDDLKAIIDEVKKDLFTQVNQATIKGIKNVLAS